MYLYMDWKQEFKFIKTTFLKDQVEKVFNTAYLVLKPDFQCDIKAVEEHH